MTAPHTPLFQSRFEVTRILGSGAMGVVLEAVDKETRATVAVKTLRTLSADALARFKSEFREFQGLSHPNLVALGELFNDEGQWFFTMELVKGCSLLEWLRGVTRLGPDHETLVAPVVPGTGPEQQALQSELAPGTFDEGRARSALRQLAQGLIALHEAGKVHRDLKPNNVLVTAEGRVVVVDYGLGIDTDRAVRDENEVVGTVAYMSPEQGAARRLTAASDWYSFGVMLFEAITGRVPFAGSVWQVLSNKQTQPAPSVHALAPDAPADLARLAEALLNHEPNLRPHGAEVIARLAGASVPIRGGSSHSLSLGHVFVGRRHELQALTQAASALASGGAAQLVCISGESGLGKSSLLRQFARQLSSEHPDAWVLNGVCYERESAPYKGVDGALDELTSVLCALPDGEVRALLPPGAALLPEFFPVLGRVAALAELNRSGAGSADPLTLRERLFSALRGLFVNVAAAHPVVLVIDDLQWANADTWALLNALLRPPSAPRLLCIFTLRSEDPQAAAAEQRLEALAPEAYLPLPLSRLSEPDGRLLARQLIERLGDDASQAGLVAAEAGGHPLFIDALVRHRDSSPGEKVSLDEALWLRSRQLPESAQTVLALVALSKGSLQQEAVARAALLDAAEFNRQVGALRVMHLVRSTGVRALDTLLPFHDRVRIAVRSHLTSELTVALHRRLAAAIEAGAQPDLEALVWHWSEAHDGARAASFAERAGDQAIQRLAFDRAAELFADALRFTDHGPADRQRLFGKRGEALTNAGRGADAAAAFQQAAELADPYTMLNFRRRAADQLLRSGYLEEGVAAVRSVLAAVGERLASSPGQALASLLWGRARLSLRGERFKPRQAVEIPPDELMRVDATWSAGVGLSLIDLVRGAEMQTRNLLLALSAGEPSRVARALALESAITATGGPSARARAERLNDRAFEVASRLTEPAVTALATLSRGVIRFQNNEWAAAQADIVAALVQLGELGGGVWWELNTARMFYLTNLYYLGRMHHLIASVPTWIHESERRDDLYALTNLRLSHCNAVWLATDEPARCLREIELAFARWSPQGYLAQHYYALLGRTTVELYQGDGQGAHARVESEWPRLKGSLLFRAFVIRFEALHLRARAAVAEGSPAALQLALKLCTKLEREKVPSVNALALGVRAAVEARQGRNEEANRLLRQAADRFAALDMAMHAQAARWWLGGEATSGAQAFFTAEGVKVPEKFSRYLLPGFG